MKLNKKGFTLVELLAVIAVLGVIISATTISVVSIINKSRKQTQKEMENNFKEAAITHCIDNGTLKDNNECVVTSDDLKNEFDDSKKHCKNVSATVKIVTIDSENDIEDYEAELSGSCNK